MKTLKLLLILLVVGGGVAFGASSIQKGSTKNLFENPVEYLPVATTTSRTIGLADAIADATEPPSDYIKYENERYGFSYYHSPQAKITEYDEGGGAVTVVQENEQSLRGLQIFIVPYDKDVITEDRFYRDIPSGIRYNIRPTTLGEKRIPAVTFNSQDDFLGETREVWFIHNGHLYEITTFKGFGEWFAPIMQTWRFL